MNTFHLFRGNHYWSGDHDLWSSLLGGMRSIVQLLQGPNGHRSTVSGCGLLSYYPHFYLQHIITLRNCIFSYLCLTPFTIKNSAYPRKQHNIMCLINLRVVVITLVASSQAAASFIPTERKGTPFLCERFWFQFLTKLFTVTTSHCCGLYQRRWCQYTSSEDCSSSNSRGIDKTKQFRVKVHFSQASFKFLTLVLKK